MKSQLPIPQIPFPPNPAMSTVDFSQLSAMPLDLVHLEPGGTAARSDSEKLFDAYLKRANTAPAPPKADRQPANSREDRPDPPQAEKSRRSNDTDAPSAKKDASSDREPLKTSDLQDKETASSASEKPADKENTPDASAKSTSEGDKKPSEKTDVQTADQNDAQKTDAQSNEKVAASEEEKSKVEDGLLKAAAQSADAAAQNSPAAIAMQAQPQVMVSTEKAVAADDISVKTDLAVDVSGKGSLPGEQSAGKAKTPIADAASAAVAATAAATAANQPAAEDASGPANSPSGDGKSKAKKTQEAAAELKSALQKQNSTVEKPSDASATVSDAAPAVTGNSAADALKGSTAISQATANVLQTALDAMKIVEKPAKAEDSAGSIGEIRANPAAQSASSSSVKESATASASQGSDPASPAVRTQFIERVERAFAAMGERDGSVRLKLSPPELGSLTLEVRVHKGELHARVEAETPAAKSLLLDNLPALREKLAQQNINIRQFDVNLTDRQSGGMSQQTFGQAHSGTQQENRFSPRTNTPDKTTAAVASSSTAQRAGMGGGLNVIV